MSSYINRALVSYFLVFLTISSLFIRGGISVLRLSFAYWIKSFLSFTIMSEEGQKTNRHKSRGRGAVLPYNVRHAVDTRGQHWFSKFELASKAILHDGPVLRLLMGARPISGPPRPPSLCGPCLGFILAFTSQPNIGGGVTTCLTYVCYLASIRSSMDHSHSIWRSVILSRRRTMCLLRGTMGQSLVFSAIV